jgi:hypothetical protein
MLRIRDPEEFYRMPPHLQDLWIEHAANTWTGAYSATPKTAPQSAAEANRIVREGIERARQREAGGSR